MRKNQSARISFFSMCRALSRPALAQGFGGNISAKIGGGRMFIKASGVRLADVGSKGGFSALEYERIAGFYGRRAPGNAKDASDAIAGSILPGGEKKPSMEAGFHSFLGTYVAHLHPVCFNAIASQKDAKRRFEEIFGKGKFVWVDYARPGHELAKKIRRATRKNRECAIFLKNHGVVASSENASKCVSLVNEIERKSREYLEKNADSGIFAVSRLKKSGAAWLNATYGAKEFSKDQKNASRFLFPDAAVFFSGAFRLGSKIRAIKNRGVEYRLPKKEAEAANETLCAHIFIMKAAGALGKPSYLSRNEIRGLCGMESEKHRKKMAGI